MRVSFAGVAQLVERNLAKVEVASSRLVSRSIPTLCHYHAKFFSLLCPVSTDILFDCRGDDSKC